MKLMREPSWMDPIIAYLKNGELLEEKIEARILWLKAAAMCSMMTNYIGGATHATSEMRTPHRGEEHYIGDPRGHMLEPHWGAIPGVQIPEVGLLLANHEGRLHGVSLEMRQVQTVLTSIKSSSRRAHFND